MLYFRDVKKSYTKDKLVLKGINLHIRKGEMIFVIGLSGAGKSTLMKMITREEKPTSGTIQIFNEETHSLVNIDTIKPHIYRRKIGIVFQEVNLIEEKSVFDNIAFPLQVLGENKKTITQRVNEVLSMTGIEYLKNKMPSELSGGEKQRVGIARALINKPSLLIADEPTGNLDYKTTESIMNLLSHINKLGTTVIMVTHDINAVNNSTGRILQIYDGIIYNDVIKN